MKLIRLFTKIFFAICILLALAGIYNQYLLYVQELAIEQELLAQLEYATQINDRLIHELEHHLSHEYIEIAAREMGLVKNHEMLFVDIN